MELKCEAKELTQGNSGSLTLKIEAVEPVHWTITAAIDPSDLAALRRLFLRPSVFLAVIRMLFARPGKTAPPALEATTTGTKKAAR